MLFTPDNAQKILDGLKTQTRRPVQNTDLARMNLHGQIISVLSVYNDLSRRIKWEVGRVYAVQPGRGEKGIGYIELLSIRREQLQDISEVDAKADGVSAWQNTIKGVVYRPEYELLWQSIYSKSAGLRWGDNPAVWVLEFKLAERR